MKKFILFLSIVAIQNTSFGQRIDIGIKGGVNFSKLEIPDISTANKTGYHLGAYSLFKFGKLGIQPELFFLNRDRGLTWEIGMPNTSIFR